MNGTLLTVAGFMLIFVATTLGAALVFFFRKNLSDNLNTVFLGCAAGIMTAASVWSLLIPAIEGATDYGFWSFAPAATGFMLGGLFLVLLDKCASRVYGFGKGGNRLKSDFKKPMKMFLAMTMHNIPEGLAVGFAFGAACGEKAALFSALGLAFGIAIQNFPEGAAVSLPLKKATGSNLRAFLFGTGSGAVEPVAAVLGYFLASTLTVAQPWLLSFAAGAMIFVVAEDLIPDAKSGENAHLGTWGVMIGFALMMALDVALG